MKTAFACLAAVASCSFSLAEERLAVGPFPEMVWPISGTSTPDKIGYSFGPRRYKADQRYGYGRGLDIAVDEGTEVHAVADGTVRIAGKHPSYEQPLVQLQHAKPGDDRQSCYTMYMWLKDATVKEGDEVKQGQVIGHSGKTPNGYQRMRFELRDGGTSQGFAVHPLHALPYSNSTPPRLSVHNVSAGKTHSTVEMTVSVPSDEMDLVRVELEVVVAGKGEPHKVVYDMDEWNRRYAKEPKTLEQPEVEGIEFAPDYFQVGADEFRLDLRFFELPPAPNAASLKVTARAIDVHGKSIEIRRPK
jgi:hypothetical protein